MSKKRRWNPSSTFALAVSLAVLLLTTGCKSVGGPAPTPLDSAPIQPIMTSSTFMVVSDIHLDHTLGTSDYGVDTGTDLWKSAQGEIGGLLTGGTPPDFILYLGDLPAHSQPTCDLDTDIGEVLGGLRGLAENAKVPLLYLPGNNDSLWGDYCIFSDSAKTLEPPYSQDSGHASDWPVINGAASCAGATGACVIDDSHRSAGYYSAYPSASRDLRVVMMNTVMFTTKDCYCTTDSGCASNAGCGSWSDKSSQGNTQLGWIGTQLDEAKTNREQVLIAMHVPPGQDLYCYQDKNTGQWLTHQGVMWQDPSQQNTFLKHVSDHQDRIVGVLTSHTHMDEIRLMHGPNGPTTLGISAPGISPNHGNNPGFKVIQYVTDTQNNGTTIDLTGFTTHYIELPVASSSWQTYDFGQYYSCPGHTSSLFDCVNSEDETTRYTGMEQTLYVQHGTPQCDVSGIMDVEYTGSN